MSRLQPTRDWSAVIARLATEPPLTLTEAAELLPREGGRKVHAVSVKRWITRGKRGVYLDGRRSHGRGWWTSAAALRRFEAALSALIDGEVAPNYESVSEFKKRARAAAAELERMGA